MFTLFDGSRCNLFSKQNFFIVQGGLHMVFDDDVVFYDVHTQYI